MSDNRFTIVYTGDAINDLSNIYSYIAYELFVPKVAKKQVGRIRNAIGSLDFMPESHPLVDFEPFRARGVRRLVVDNFVTFYDVDKKTSTVRILAIIYGRRDMTRILSDRDHPTDE